jgi:DNA-binding YbaB/EbfC family protein
MLKGMGDLGNIMKLQKELKNIQKKLKKIETQGESRDGAIRATVNGDFKLVNITIDPEFLEKSDREKLEESIMAAVNSAVEQSKSFAAKEMSKLTGGMNIPGLSDFFK